MNNQICGLMVVRRPPENIYPGEFVRRVVNSPDLGNIDYGGVDRMPWFDIDELYYEGRLPVYLMEKWGKLKISNSNLTGLLLVNSLEDVNFFYQKLNSDLVAKNEIIALFSRKLENLVATFQTHLNLQWLGMEPKCLGEWSLLSEGLFLFPDKFLPFVNCLNKSGLFDNEETCQRYTETYLKLAHQGEVEEIGAEPYIDNLQIWRVNVGGKLSWQAR